MSDLDDRIADIVRFLEREGALGERFKGKHGSDEIRFGTHGSLSVIVRGTSRGNWFDHEAETGGGPWALIQRTHNNPGDWLRDHHLIDEPEQSRRRQRVEREWGNNSSQQGDTPDPEPPHTGPRQPLATYDYADELGNLLYQVVRFPNHEFRQRRPDGKGWVWNLKDTRRVLYHLPELIAAKKTGNGHPWRVLLSEGEKDCDRARADWGVTATTNPGGAGYWDNNFDAYFAGAEVILLEDNDDAGRARSAKLAPRLTAAGAVVKIIHFNDLPEHADLSDWMDSGGSQSVFEDIIDNTEPWRAPPPEPIPALWPTTRISDWTGREIAEREWIMPEWVPRGQTTGLYGVGGVRKTDWLIQFMVAACVGGNFCGVPVAKCPVYGLFCEDERDEILRRAKRISGALGLDFAHLTDFRFASLVGEMNTELMLWDPDKGGKHGPVYDYFDQEISTYHPGLIVLDTLPDFFGGNEVDRRQTSTFYRLLDGLSIRYGCAILASAHPSMRGRTSGRLDSGNTGIEGKMRARLTLHDPGDDPEDPDEDKEERAHRIALNPSDKRILTRQKSNYAKPGATIDLILRDGAFFPKDLDPNQTARYGAMFDMAVRVKFKEILTAIIASGDYVNDSENVKSRYAPGRFYSHALNRQSKYSRKDFQRAMRHLLDVAKEIRIAYHGHQKHRELRFVTQQPLGGI